MSAKLIVTLTITSLAAAGCDAGSTPAGEWVGAVYDSAGVTFVANPEFV